MFFFVSETALAFYRIEVLYILMHFDCVKFGGYPTINPSKIRLMSAFLRGHANMRAGD